VISLAVDGNAIGLKATFENLTVREITGNALTYENIGDEQPELYTKTSDGWLGEEAIANGSFESQDGWTLGDNVSIVDGVLLGTTLDSPNNSSLTQNNTFDTGYSYLVSYEGTVDSGTYGMQDGEHKVLSGRIITPTISEVEFIYLAESTSFGCKRGSMVNNLTFDNVSVKRLLQTV